MCVQISLRTISGVVQRSTSVPRLHLMARIYKFYIPACLVELGDVFLGKLLGMKQCCYCNNRPAVEASLQDANAALAQVRITCAAKRRAFLLSESYK